MKLKIIFITTFSMIYNGLNSQNIAVNVVVDDLGMAYRIQDYASLTRLNNPETGNLIKTFFLFDNWTNNCTVKLTSRSLKLNRVNFKIETNEFMLEYGKDSIFSFNTKNIDLITIKDRKFKYKLYNGENKFFEILLEANKGISFYKGYNIRVLPKSTIGVLNRPYDVKKKEVKFYILKEESLFSFKLKKKKILKLLDKNKHDIILKYIKKNKLSYKREKDVIEIFKYYNTIKV